MEKNRKGNCDTKVWFVRRVTGEQGGKEQKSKHENNTKNAQYQGQRKQNGYITESGMGGGTRGGEKHGNMETQAT